MTDPPTSLLPAPPPYPGLDAPPPPPLHSHSLPQPRAHLYNPRSGSAAVMRVTVQGNDGAEMTMRLSGTCNIYDVKMIWSRYQAAFDGDEPTDEDLFAFVDGETALSDSLLLNSFRRAEDGLRLKAVKLEPLPTYIEDWTADPGVGVTMKRFHHHQIEMRITNGNGYAMHAWPTSTGKDVAQCWAWATGVPVGAISVFHGSHEVGAGDTLGPLMAQALSRTPGRSMREFNGRFTLQLDIPKRYAKLYPRF